MPNSFAATSTILKALAEPMRLQMIRRLHREGPATVSELTKELGATIANVSHNLKCLREVGLVTTKKRGKFVTYSLNPEMAIDGKLRIGCCLLVIDGAECCA